MQKIFIVITFATIGIVAVAAILMGIVRSRAKNNTVRCQHHLMQLGLYGFNHPSLPGEPLPKARTTAFPPGTVPHDTLAPQDRFSWYLYTLNIFSQDIADLEVTQAMNIPQNRQPRRLASLNGFYETLDYSQPWDRGGNSALAKFRLTVAICPERAEAPLPGLHGPNFYIANGGLGAETPSKSLDEARLVSGMFRYNAATRHQDVSDGLSQTIQLLETSKDIGFWLQGGPSTLRGLQTEAEAYVGPGQQFGGNHADGMYASFADGSARFIRNSADVRFVRTLLTIAGGDNQEDFNFRE